LRVFVLVAVGIIRRFLTGRGPQAAHARQNGRAFPGGESMPIYEYQCQSCGHELEKLQKLSDAPLILCPQCGKEELRRKISAAGFRLKGAGWYETDFKKGGKKNLAGDAGGSSDSSSSASSPSSSASSTPAPAAASGTT
jgi:putative FmdB family regulatory protein